MDVQWNVWSDATSEKSTRNVAARLLRQLGRTAKGLTFAPYPRTNGWMFSFQTALNGATWNDIAVDAIALGQRVAYAWTLSGEVSRNPEGWATQSRISGVTAIQWQLRSQGHLDAMIGDTRHQ